VLGLACLPPWIFGGVRSDFLSSLGIGHKFLFIFYAGVAVLPVLWGTRALLEGQLSWKKCPVAACLGALVLVGVWQVTPLPRGVLGWLSPGTARAYEQLLPSQPEALPSGEQRAGGVRPAGSTISLYPGGTRAQLVQLLAVFLLFVVARNNVASAAGVRRLSIAALANGALLAVFGLAQFLSSPHRLFWTYDTPWPAFGPFNNRNHFAFYLNICVGLGAGLLLARYLRPGRTCGGRGLTPAGRPGASSRRSHPGGATRRTWGERDRAPADDREHRRWVFSPPALLNDPQGLWIITALALMIGATVICRSRGGGVALLGAFLLGLIITLRRCRRLWGLGTVLLILALALGLVTWLGSGTVLARYRTLWAGDALRDGRIPLWSRTLPLVKDFPLWGTGYGTFVYVEFLRRSSVADEALYVYAHNDYLEALVEGGLVRFILSLAAVGLVARLGYRAICRHGGHSASGLALGALCAFSTVAVHSFFEFGLHIPAIALLATVLCAYLCALSDGEEPSVRQAATAAQAGGPRPYALRLWGLAPAAAAVAVLLGLLLVREGWKACRAEELRAAALRQSELPGPISRTLQQIEYLERAARLAPEDVGLQIELAQAHLNLLREDLTREHLVPALRHLLLARDLCPLRLEPHMQLAAFAEKLEKGDPRSAYLGRAKLVVPNDPTLWYVWGGMELSDEGPEQACKSWRRSLELSDQYLPAILDECADRLTPQEVLGRVLPDDPGLLARAASHLYPWPEQAAERRPLLERALVLLEQRPGPLQAQDLQTKAVIHTSLGQPAEALAAYRAALRREPQQADWRYEFAQLLYQQGHAQEARREVLLVLRQQPEHAKALQLLEAGTRQGARARPGSPGK
jgi:O-antigen ligase/tetratricopeptide (TPR) repeat protein